MIINPRSLYGGFYLTPKIQTDVDLLAKKYIVDKSFHGKKLFDCANPFLDFTIWEGWGLILDYQYDWIITGDDHDCSAKILINSDYQTNPLNLQPLIRGSSQYMDTEIGVQGADVCFHSLEFRGKPESVFYKKGFWLGSVEVRLLKDNSNQILIWTF